MIVMPANASGWFWHCLARETGRIGHLYSPGAQRGPWPWIPYALDNGVFSMWNPADNSFDEDRWKSSGEAAWKRLLFWAQTAPIKPQWFIIPDRPGSKEETLQKWTQYAPEAKALGLASLAVAVQNGMEPWDVRSMDPQPDVICVGGTTDWKWETAPAWCAAFPRVHVLRCNSPAKLEVLETMGCESCDGTGWNRGDRKQTIGLEKWARKAPSPTEVPLYAHVCRGERKGGTPGQLSFA
jgi:hypothetical protein